MIAYRAMLDVPADLVAHLAKLLAAERRRRGTRRNTRALNCRSQALLVLIWYRKREEMTMLAAGFGISRATAYRYRDEALTVLHATAPDLHDALRQVAAHGFTHVILDGKVFRTDRCAQTTLGTKGQTIHRWYSGKHRGFGGNIQALMRPDGLPIWTSPVVPGHRHDLTAATETNVLAALYWSATHLGLPCLADAGYDRAGHGIHTPIKHLRNQHTGRGGALTADHQTYNTLLRSTRAVGERGFALLTTRWRALQRITASPSKIGAIVAGALVLTHFEHQHLLRPC